MGVGYDGFLWGFTIISLVWVCCFWFVCCSWFAAILGDLYSSVFSGIDLIVYLVVSCCLGLRVGLGLIIISHLFGGFYYYFIFTVWGGLVWVISFDLVVFLC